MSFESARFEPVSPGPGPEPYDRAALAALLDAAPNAFADPHGAGTWHLSVNQRVADQARAARLADPSRFPPGVLVRLRERDVLVDQQGGVEDLARGREIVAWLLGHGRWRVVTERGDQGVVTDVDALYPQRPGHRVLPDPASLADDPLLSPPVRGRIWRWEAAAGALLVHLPSGVCGFEGPGGALRCRGKLDADTRAALVAAVADLELEDVDEGGAVAVRWEDADGTDEVAYFPADAVPDALAPLALVAAPLLGALAAWSPGDAVPPGLSALAPSPSPSGRGPG